MAAQHFLSSIKSPSKNNLSTCIVLKLDYEQSLFFLLRRAKRPRHVSRPRFSRLAASSIGSLSKDVFEPRTSTGSEAFSLFICLDTNKLVLLSFFSLLKTIYPRVSTKSFPSDAKSPLPVDVRRSKTLLLKFPNQRSRARALPLLNLTRKRDCSQSVLKTNN